MAPHRDTAPATIHPTSHEPIAIEGLERGGLEGWRIAGQEVERASRGYGLEDWRRKLSTAGGRDAVLDGITAGEGWVWRVGMGGEETGLQGRLERAGLEGQRE